VLTIEFAQLEREVLRILEQAHSEAARSAKHSAAVPKNSGPSAS
jgi:hypothetical protein